MASQFNSLVKDVLACVLQQEAGDVAGGSSVDDPPDVKDVIADAMTTCLRNVAERFNSYHEQCKKLKEKGRFNSDRVRKQLLRMENYLMEKYRQKEAMILYTREASRNCYMQAWRNCHDLVINNLCTRNVKEILESLRQDDVVSVSDQQSIIGKGTEEAQVEGFYSLVQGRTEDEFDLCIVPAIEKEHGHLADKIRKEVNDLEEEEEEEKCAACLVRQTVQVRTIAGPLYDSKAINRVLYDDLVSSLSNRQKWEELRAAKVPDEEIINALKPKYPDFYVILLSAKKKNLDCFCGEECDKISMPSQISSATSSTNPTSAVRRNLGDTVDFEEFYPLKKFASTYTEETDLEYPMNAQTCGYCVIINNKGITTSAGFIEREGTDIDAEKLRSLFTQLQFNVMKYENLTNVSLVKQLTEFAKHDHSEYDAFVCFLLCHGEEDRVFGINGKSVSVSSLTKLFRASSCPSLAGKPKLFFVQSSRGLKNMSGLEVQIVTSSGDAPSNEDHKNSSESNQERLQRVIPDEADFLIGYSTTAGYSSFRSSQNGSWYIFKLHEILDKYADRYDLLSCLMMVNGDIAEGNAYIDGKLYKQMPAPVVTLTKKVHLTKDPSLPDVNQEQ